MLTAQMNSIVRTTPVAPMSSVANLVVPSASRCHGNVIIMMTAVITPMKKIVLSRRVTMISLHVITAAVFQWASYVIWIMIVETTQTRKTVTSQTYRRPWQLGATPTSHSVNPTVVAYTMNMTNKESGPNIQFFILPSTIAVVDKGTSLHCYYVKISSTCEYACDTCSIHFYIIAVKGVFFCLPQQLLRVE